MFIAGFIFGAVAGFTMAMILVTIDVREWVLREIVIRGIKKRRAGGRSSDHTETESGRI